MQQKDYVKYTYWLEPEQVDGFEKEIRSRGHRLKWGRGVVCAPLDPFNTMTMVTPVVWNETCSRQGSWYRKSARCGQYLLVSSVPVQHAACIPNTVIRRSEFQSSRPAMAGERARLVQSRLYLEHVPAEWPCMDAQEKKRWKALLARVQMEVDWELLLEVHSANHANFLDPLIYTEEAGQIVPCSIDHSRYLCSCCLEMYNIIGAGYRKKLVRPCMGAMFFARLEADRFYEVAWLEGVI
jgi:hypothetical protein